MCAELAESRRRPPLLLAGGARLLGPRQQPGPHTRRTVTCRLRGHELPLQLQLQFKLQLQFQRGHLPLQLRQQPEV